MFRLFDLFLQKTDEICCIADFFMLFLAGLFFLL